MIFEYLDVELNGVEFGFAEIFRERIIEYCLDSGEGPLAAMSTGEFVRSVAARSSAPGGGSVSALIGALVRFKD